MIEIVVAGDAAELSLNKRLFYLKRAKLNRKWRETAMLVYKGSGWGRFSGRVRISFIIRRGRRLDHHNAMSSGAIKACIDGLVDAGMIENDSEQYLEVGTVRQEIGKQWRDFPEVVICIEEANGGG